MKSHRSLVRIIVSMLLPLTVLLSVALPAAARTTYPPDRIGDALLNDPMLSSEELFGGVIGRKAIEPDALLSSAGDRVLVFSIYGGVAFDIYATDEQALSDSHVDVLDPIQDQDDPSITYYILWGTGDANTPAGAYVVMGNVVVNGFATPQDAYDAGLSGDVSAAAALASNHAKHGVDFLRRVGGGAAPTATAEIRHNAPTPISRPAPTATHVITPPTATIPATTVLVPAAGPTTVEAPQLSSVHPEMVIPGGLRVQSGPDYRLDRAEAINLTSSGTTTPQAVGTYTASQVAWILDHPDFMKGGPYREIQALLSASPSPFFALFADPEAVANSLSQFGWQEGYLREYSLDTPSGGAAGWVEASAHRFASVEGAQRAVRYLADQFEISSALAPVPLATTADATFAYSGPESDGNETAMFAQRGNFVIAVIGVAPSGSPDATIQAVVDSAVAALDT